MSRIRLFTIGFTKKSAESFFTALRNAGVKRVIDVRLKNSSQLAGFAKRDDLCYFLKALCEIDYLPMPELAPTQDILDEYKNHGNDWAVYERKFRMLMSERRIEGSISRETLDGACLLCSEAHPDHCHRRLVAEYLEEKWGDVEIGHLV